MLSTFIDHFFRECTQEGLHTISDQQRSRTHANCYGLVKKVICNKREQVDNNAWFEDRSLRTTHSQECPWLCAHHQGTGVCGSLGDNPRESQVFGKTLDEDQHQLGLSAQQKLGPRFSGMEALEWSPRCLLQHKNIPNSEAPHLPAIWGILFVPT